MRIEKLTWVAASGALVGLLAGLLAGCEPVEYPCVAGVEEGHSYTTTLTKVGEPDDATSFLPSCTGAAQIDDLGVGSVIVSEIPVHAARNGDPQACEYPTAVITSDVGLSDPVPTAVERPAIYGSTQGEDLFLSVYRVTVQGCALEWELETFSEDMRPLAMPLRLWAARQVTFAPDPSGSAPSAACLAAFPNLTCEDVWDITIQEM